jgi:hypothetical protein
MASNRAWEGRDDNAPVVIGNGGCAQAKAILDRVAELGLAADFVDVQVAGRYASLSGLIAAGVMPETIRAERFGGS